MPNEIDVASLTTCEVAPDGQYVRLTFEDAHGSQATLRLTSACVQQLVAGITSVVEQHSSGAEQRLTALLPDWN
jgi:hypothetical protein